MDNIEADYRCSIVGFDTEEHSATTAAVGGGVASVRSFAADCTAAVG